MAIPAWPNTIPQDLLVEGYSQSLANVTIRSYTDTGPAMVRRRATAGVQPVSGKQWMTRTELAYLITFYNATLLGGSLRFTWNDPMTGSSAEFRFTEPPAWTSNGIDVAVDLSLEILP